MKVLDASGIINARDKEIEERFLTVPEVKAELKDVQSRMKFDAAVAAKKIKFEEPSDASLMEVWDVAEENGVLSMLSETDIKILALAKEKKLSVVTDDYDMQNMCKIMGLGFDIVSMRGISKPIAWKHKCNACGKQYARDVKECEACGSTSFSVLRRT